MVNFDEFLKKILIFSNKVNKRKIERCRMLKKSPYDFDYQRVELEAFEMINRCSEQKLALFNPNH